MFLQLVSLANAKEIADSIAQDKVITVKWSSFEELNPNSHFIGIIGGTGSIQKKESLANSKALDEADEFRVISTNQGPHNVLQ